MGRVAGSYGIRGWLKVAPGGGVAAALSQATEGWIGERPDAVAEAKVHGAGGVAKLEVMESRGERRAGWGHVATWTRGVSTPDNCGTVDARLSGGGPGRVMLAEPLEKALDAARGAGAGRVIYLSPQGRRLDHGKVMELSKQSSITLLCGRYEGVDERLLGRRVDEELSLGDYVLSGGELAAMALIDACVRQLPGALGDENSALEESFAAGGSDRPLDTRPPVFLGGWGSQGSVGADHQ